MLEYFEELARKYNVSLSNVLSIALNRYGIVTTDTTDSRLRFNLDFMNSGVNNYFAVCVNTYPDSPFRLIGNNLYLEDGLIGKVSGIEKDTCTSTYFRNNKKVITFNSNARSQCAGCKFCGTYSLGEDDNYDFSKKENIINYFNNLLSQNDIASMADIENVTICTGCFENEDELIKHLLLLSEAFNELGFNGSLNYIGSQLRSYDKIKMISETIPNFGMYLTIEKFLEREKFMRPEKASLTLDKAHDLMSYTSELGITTTFLYILGLEDIETVKKYFEYLSDSINKYPIVQVFQDYTPQQEKYRCEEAKDVAYYLEARRIIEQIFQDTTLNPKLWESFRSLYYQDKPKGLVLKNE